MGIESDMILFLILTLPDLNFTSVKSFPFIFIFVTVGAETAKR